LRISLAHAARILPLSNGGMEWNTLLRSSRTRRALIVASQAVLTACGFYAAFALSWDFDIPASRLRRFAETLPYLVLVRLVLSHRFRLDRGYWHYVGMQDLVHLVAATILGSLLFPLVLLVVGQLRGIPASVFMLEGLLALALAGGLRMAARLARERGRWLDASGAKRTFIVGAGDAGEQILRQLLHDRERRYHIVGLIDDDPDKQGRSLHGVPVLGTADQIVGLVALHRVTQALIAIPSATSEQLTTLAEHCVRAGVDVQVLPPLKDLVTGQVQVSQIRDIQLDDLLGREPITLDLQSIEPEIAGRVIAVTGAGGSIGSELARQIAGFRPRSLVLIDRAESALHYIHCEIAKAHPSVHVVPVLASVTNGERLLHTFEIHRPDCVFHAAAYKHVPMLEWNVVEGVWNNVIGTLYTARCASRVGARKFVLISTDKAVNPTSVLGATKLIAERIVLDLPSLRNAVTDYRVVRFGNVLGSDGSVVPTFQRQLESGGPLTITHPEMRRYFMTIPEAVQLVLQATALDEGKGRIAVLEMGSQVRILDLAHQMIRLAGLLPEKDIAIEFVGLRPGEKLEEELVGPGEVALETSIDKIRVLERNGNHGEELARRLRHLTQMTARRDEQALLRALSMIVPEYHPGGQLTMANGNGHGHGYARNGNGNGHQARNGHRPRAAFEGNGHNGNGKRHSKSANGRLQNAIEPPAIPKLRTGTQDGA
jgi:FlaA1/EpsC-like NDP-sugar epimerase